MNGWDGSQIALISGALVTIIAAIGGQAVLIVRALNDREQKAETSREQTRSDMADMATDVRDVKVHTDGLVKQAKADAHKLGVAEGVKQEKAAH